MHRLDRVLTIVRLDDALLASPNHPHTAAICGLEEGAGMTTLVMVRIDGAPGQRRSDGDGGNALARIQRLERRLRGTVGSRAAQNEGGSHHECRRQ